MLIALLWIVFAAAMIAVAMFLSDNYALADRLTWLFLMLQPYLPIQLDADQFLVWVTVLSLETVVVGGGVTEALGYPYLERIRGSFRENVFPPKLGDAELLMTELEADSVLLGAALLAREAISD